MSIHPTLVRTSAATSNVLVGHKTILSGPRTKRPLKIPFLQIIDCYTEIITN